MECEWILKILVDGVAPKLAHEKFHAATPEEADAKARERVLSLQTRANLSPPCQPGPSMKVILYRYFKEYDGVELIKAQELSSPTAT
jgi:hypothetical protein